MRRRQLLLAGASLSLLRVSEALAQGALARPQGGTAMPLEMQIALDHPLQEAWKAWKALCLAPEGRVVDAFQDQASHSEGQGYGLALAAIFGDLTAAEQIIGWTEANLAIRRDGLLAWRWLADAVPQVADRNNASDGDLFYAWGLMLLGQRAPDRPEFGERAMAMAKAIDRHCVIQNPDGSGQPVFLPGVDGFRRSEGVIINPSYAMPRLLRDLAGFAAIPRLAQLADSAEAMVETLAQQGPVPDWVLLTPSGMQAPPPPFAGVSGYEAVRVPLFMLWSNRPQSAVLRRYREVMLRAGDEGGTPTVIDPQNEKVFERSAHLGYAAVAALAQCAGTDSFGSAIPSFATDQPYYPATLHLMALVVQVTVYPRCIPL